jgi:acyl carrier protein
MADMDQKKTLSDAVDSDDILCETIIFHLKNIENVTLNLSKGATSFADMGLDSISMMMITSEFEERLDVELPPHLLWDCPDLPSFARYLRANVGPDILERFIGAAMPPQRAAT